MRQMRSGTESAPQVMRAWMCIGIAVVAVVITGCRAPIGADRTSTRMAYKQITASALTLGLTDDSRIVLHRFNLTEEFKGHPDAALRTLHQRAETDDRRDLLFALAELNYLRGEQLHRSVRPWEPRHAPDRFLASAVFAWFYLFGDSSEPRPDPYDRRFRVACDLYNRAVARAFATGPTTNSVIQFSEGTRALASGDVRVHLVEPKLQWKLDRIHTYLPADEFTVRGLTVRDRQSGLGAPLIAVHEGGGAEGFLRPTPVTLFLRLSGDLKSWSRVGLQASVELYSTYEIQSVKVGDRTVPLEGDVTAPLAYSLNDDFIWELGMAQFFSAQERIPSDIYLTQPYVPGRVPVVFVHGTFSSPVWWAEMWNTLRNDPYLNEHCQFWYFIYNSGNPVVYSAVNLRRRILEKIQTLDPEGKDPALQQMVVIGHSQGGLLTKLTATDTGDKLWRVYFDKDFDEMEMKPETRERVQRYTFFKPLPCVKRVIFISTPHRGSFLANNLVRKIARRFISLPKDVLSITATLLTLSENADVPAEVRSVVPNSLDQMSPNNKLIRALAELPTAPGIHAHSIIPVRGSGPPEEGNDGVVKYTSAHVDYAESEFVVRSSHGCQGRPETIEEVRRILLEHLAGLKTKE